MLANPIVHGAAVVIPSVFTRHLLSFCVVPGCEQARQDKLQEIGRRNGGDDDDDDDNDLSLPSPRGYDNTHTHTVTRTLTRTLNTHTRCVLCSSVNEKLGTFSTFTLKSVFCL